MVNRNQFLSQLEASLNKLPVEEKQDILQDFEDHFSFGIAEGKTEEEIASALGSPQQIAKEMVAAHHIEKVEQSFTTGNILRAVLAAISLGFFNVIIVLGPFLALVSVVFAGWLAAVSMILSPVLVLINIMLFAGSFMMFDLFIAILACGIGLFLAIGMYFITKILMKTFVKYLKLNMKLVKGDSL